MQDLQEIWRYCAHVASLDVAERIAREISCVAAGLENDPLIGRDRDELWPGLRSFRAHPYSVFYRIREN
jgi:plasmid stabilization system protein ParE